MSHIIELVDRVLAAHDQWAQREQRRVNREYILSHCRVFRDGSMSWGFVGVRRG